MVPRKGEEVAPEAICMDMGSDGFDVCTVDCVDERREPLFYDLKTDPELEKRLSRKN